MVVDTVVVVACVVVVLVVLNCAYDEIIEVLMMVRLLQQAALRCLQLQ